MLADEVHSCQLTGKLVEWVDRHGHTKDIPDLALLAEVSNRVYLVEGVSCQKLHLELPAPGRIDIVFDQSSNSGESAISGSAGHTGSSSSHSTRWGVRGGDVADLDGRGRGMVMVMVMIMKLRAGAEEKA